MSQQPPGTPGERGWAAPEPPAGGYPQPGYAQPGYAQPGYPQPGYPTPGHPAYPVRGPGPAPARIDVIEGTGFGVVYPRVAPTRSGTAISSLAVGLASILISAVVACFGLAGASAGWGAAVAGAFAILAAFIGLGAIWLGLYGLRQIRRRGVDTVTGRGMAIGGIACGACGVGLTALAFVASLVATLSPAG